MLWLTSLLPLFAQGALVLADSQTTLLSQSVHLHELSTHDYTALSHPRFPGRGVRVKKTEFCDATVKYVDV